VSASRGDFLEGAHEPFGVALCNLGPGDRGNAGNQAAEGQELRPIVREQQHLLAIVELDEIRPRPRPREQAFHPAIRDNALEEVLASLGIV